MVENVRIELGEEKTLKFTYKDSAGVVIPLSGATFALDIYPFRNSPTKTFTKADAEFDKANVLIGEVTVGIETTDFTSTGVYAARITAVISDTHTDESWFTISVMSPALDDVIRYLGITDTDDDALIGDLIDSVEDLVEGYVDWEIFGGEAKYTEYHHGKSEKSIVLKRWPVVSVSALYDDLDRDFTDSTKVDEDDYVVDTKTGIVSLDGDLIFSNGNLNVKVVYTAGFETLPKSVEQVRREEVARIYHRAKQGGSGIKAERQGPYNVTWDMEALSKQSKLILNKYRTQVYVR